MSDFPQTPEAVALALLRHIVQAEGKIGGGSETLSGAKGLDKAWVLSTYRECLAATLNISPPDRSPHGP